MGLRRQLADRDGIRRLADWLARWPQLGREVFGRGAAEVSDEAHAPIPAADLTGLLRAYFGVLQRPEQGGRSKGAGARGPGQGGRYRPPLLLWRMPEALARLHRLLPAPPGGAVLEHFLPPATDSQSDQALRRRAALASTLLAGLD